MNGNMLKKFKFHDGTTTIGNGNEMAIPNTAGAIEIEINTEGTATVVFEAMGELGIWRPLLGTKETNPIEVLTTTSDISPFYQFDIIGKNKVRVRSTANSGDALYVYGRVIG